MAFRERAFYSHEEHIRRSCKTKQYYISRKEARVLANWRNEDNSTASSTLEVYYCAYCHFYHIGKSPKKGDAKEHEHN